VHIAQLEGHAHIVGVRVTESPASLRVLARPTAGGAGSSETLLTRFMKGAPGRWRPHKNRTGTQEHDTWRYQQHPGVVMATHAPGAHNSRDLTVKEFIFQLSVIKARRARARTSVIVALATFHRRQQEDITEAVCVPSVLCYHAISAACVMLNAASRRYV